MTQKPKIKVSGNVQAASMTVVTGTASASLEMKTAKQTTPIQEPKKAK